MVIAYSRHTVGDVTVVQLFPAESIDGLSVEFSPGQIWGGGFRLWQNDAGIVARDWLSRTGVIRMVVKSW
jgi:hypothetical protein